MAAVPGFLHHQGQNTDPFFHRRRRLLLSNMETSPQGLFFICGGITLSSCFEREFMSTLNALDPKKEKPGVMALLKKNLIKLYSQLSHTGAENYMSLSFHGLLSQTG